jgi:hyperosmotically inducible periplasmic protein
MKTTIALLSCAVILSACRDSDSRPSSQVSYGATTTTGADGGLGSAPNPNADNTKLNERDRAGSVTPMDQGNSAVETKVAAEIRKTIVDDSSRSMAAKNVKIIVVGNKVTLRGPVENDQERAALEGIAKRTAGIAAVDNQLEIKK